MSESSQNAGKWMTQAEAARVLGLTRARVLQLRIAGVFRASATAGGTPLLYAEDVTREAEKRKKKGRK